MVKICSSNYLFISSNVENAFDKELKHRAFLFNTEKTIHQKLKHGLYLFNANLKKKKANFVLVSLITILLFVLESYWCKIIGIYCVTIHAVTFIVWSPTPLTLLTLTNPLKNYLSLCVSFVFLLLIYTFYQYYLLFYQYSFCFTGRA